MSTDDRTLLVNLGKEVAQLAKAKASEAAKGVLQKKLTLVIADARVLVAAREHLRKDLEGRKARKKQLEIEARTFARAVKALQGRFAATGSHFPDVQKAIQVARDNGKNADPVLSRLNTAFQELQMRLMDLSPFDGLADNDAG